MYSENKVIRNILLVYILGHVTKIVLNWLDAWRITGLQDPTPESSWLWSNKDQNSWDNLDETQKFPEAYAAHGFTSVYCNWKQERYANNHCIGEDSGLRHLHSKSDDDLGLVLEPTLQKERSGSCQLLSDLNICNNTPPPKKSGGKSWIMVCLSWIIETLLAGCGYC